MLKDVVSVHPLKGNQLRLRFEDGLEGVVDISKIVPFTGVFSGLADPQFFAQVSVNKELGTITWPNGADIDPGVLYSAVAGKPLAV